MDDALVANEGAYYGAPSDSDIKTLGERLRDTYSPEDFVTVQNIDTQPLRYQFTTPSDIETFSDYPGHKNTVQKRVPQVVVLQPGETKLCAAYEADLMITNLIKQITSRKAQASADEKGVMYMTANWQDPTTQKELIKKIFIGKRDVLSSFNKEIKKADVSQDLGLKDEKATAKPS